MAKRKSNHLLVLTDGQALTGVYALKTFTVENPDGTFKVAADKVAFVHFERGNPAGTDEVLLKSTSVLKGRLLPDPLPFTVADTGQTISFRHSRINTLVMTL